MIFCYSCSNQDRGETKTLDEKLFDVVFVLWEGDIQLLVCYS